MADLITFRGSSVLADTEGVYDFTPGQMNRAWSFVRLPRGSGELAKDLGVNGATHTVVVTYIAVASGSVATLFSRIAGLQTPVSGSLVIPRYGTYPHCVVESVSWDKQTLAAKSVSPSSPKGTAVDTMRVTITFRQLRAV